ncbi:M10 family metallopeptidase C-terminal domain-containing protein [Azospirillum sp.]|uniref:M10 family metallopeptidase C-terminal domain-containing protein n=1 Tax=Azospirillum sp. TaxID=34012 RepID=UPI002D3624C7|nr:hypothetical protein [Azospirillum sp.]HYD69446.1 hypothetical protein [Azospirillum sp.]
MAAYNNTILGNDGDDVLVGSNGNDRISGGAGNDLIWGNRGHDILWGGGGDDYLYGDLGNDTLIGGTGWDVLVGNAGGDLFVFASAQDSLVEDAGWDRVMDFDPAQGDRIDLSAVDANVRQDGDQDFSFIGFSEFTGRAGQLRLIEADGSLFLEADVSGNRRANIRIELADLSAADFLQAGAVLL